MGKPAAGSVVARIRHVLTKRMQRLFWIYLTDNFVITGKNQAVAAAAKVKCSIVRITPDNCPRVLEFRADESRVQEYRRKLERNEIGLFAQTDRGMAGSIWVTVNRGSKRCVARGYMPLRPGEAMIHDIVTGELYRGLGIGGYMVERMVAVLSEEYGVGRTIVDVNVRNRASLRMMERAGVCKTNQVFYVSAFGTLLWSKVMKEYSCQR
jgi:ribosomal protein S18 acetylase RimI-like enzyme